MKGSLFSKVITSALITLVVYAVVLLWLRRLSVNAFDNRVASTKNQIAAYQTVLGLYLLDCGAPPPIAQGLSVLVTNPGVAGWKGPYLDPPQIRPDLWGTAFRYRVDGMNVIVESAGPDALFGTADDLRGIATIK